ncbi:MAG: ABC transporter ATP-binding protein [Candidatus Hodarchaeales archaeon]
MTSQKNISYREDSSIVIRVQNLGKRYKFLWALRGISLNFGKNTITGLVGANGAGKSTLLNLLGTIVTPTVGSITIFNQDVREKAEELRKKIGLFSYHSFLYDELTGWENLLFWCKLYDVQKNIKSISINQFISEKAEKFGIINWLERPIRDLSTGMRKKVDFLRILLIKPNLILLDEPFSGMDPKNISSFLKELEDLQKSSTIVIASHNLDLMINLCDNIHILKKGKVSESVVKGAITGKDLKKILTG